MSVQIRSLQFHLQMVHLAVPPHRRDKYGLWGCKGWPPVLQTGYSGGFDPRRWFFALLILSAKISALQAEKTGSIPGKQHFPGRLYQRPPHLCRHAYHGGPSNAFLVQWQNSRLVSGRSGFESLSWLIRPFSSVGRAPAC